MSLVETEVTPESVGNHSTSSSSGSSRGSGSFPFDDIRVRRCFVGLLSCSSWKTGFESLVNGSGNWIGDATDEVS